MILISNVLLAAILHKVGLVRINEIVLTKILNKAAEEDRFFKQFKRHPQYHHSEVLAETLYFFILGGLIWREGIDYYVVAPRLALKYGIAQFNKLTITQKRSVEKVAKLIRDQCQAVK